MAKKSEAFEFDKCGRATDYNATCDACKDGYCVDGGGEFGTGKCVNPIANDENCGICGNVCPDTLACSLGVCKCDGISSSGFCSSGNCYDSTSHSGASSSKMSDEIITCCEEAELYRYVGSDTCKNTSFLNKYICWQPEYKCTKCDDDKQAVDNPCFVK